MKILLAGFSDEQINNLRDLFPVIDFVPTEKVDVENAQADALIGLTRQVVDKVFTEVFLEKTKLFVGRIFQASALMLIYSRTLRVLLS